MKEALFHTPVALIFWARPEHFRRVFECVQRLRPSRLYLIQDGPREGRGDEERILACRRIAQCIDWDCQVTEDYSPVNLGCGARPMSGITEVFRREERAIILEDDCLPDMSFFPYCEYLLKRYRDDERVGLISGLNHFGEYDAGDVDCFFARAAAIGGWATWRRAWRMYDFALRDADEASLRRIRESIPHRRAAEAMDATFRRAKQELSRGERVSYWDIQWEFMKYGQNMLGVVPARNLITNIGLGEGSTHSGDLRLLPKPIAQFFDRPTVPMPIPPRCPGQVLPEWGYDKRYYDAVYPPWPVGLYRSAARRVKKMYYGRRP